MAQDWSCPPGNSNLLATETPEKPVKKDPDGVCTEKLTEEGQQWQKCVRDRKLSDECRSLFLNSHYSFSRYKSYRILRHEMNFYLKFKRIFSSL